MTTKTSPPGNRKNRSRHEGGFALLPVVFGVIIAAISFATIAGSIALLVRNTAKMKIDLYEDIDKRNTQTVELKIDFSKE